MHRTWQKVKALIAFFFKANKSNKYAYVKEPSYVNFDIFFVPNQREHKKSAIFFTVEKWRPTSSDFLHFS